MTPGEPLDPGGPGLPDRPDSPAGPLHRRLDILSSENSYIFISKQKS